MSTKKKAAKTKASKTTLNVADEAQVAFEKNPPPAKLKPKAQKARRAADAEVINPKEPVATSKTQQTTDAAARKLAKQQAKRADPKRKKKLKAITAELSAPVKVKRKGGKKGAAPSPEELSAKLAEDAEPIPAVSSKNKHPERKASKPMVLVVGDYRVFKDNANRTCIRVGVGTKNVEFIPMDSAGITVSKLSLSVFEARFKPFDYPVHRAAEQYAEASRYFGYTERAREHLEKLLDGKSGLSPVVQQDEGASLMATKKKADKKNGKASAFDPKKLIASNKGNPEALKKARAARAAGASSRFSGKKIKVLTKETGAREGTSRHAMRKAVMGCTEADKALAKTVTHDKVDYKITPKLLENMIKLKIISVS